ncbi:MAG: hypothetical protein ACLGGV_07840 [Bacteroidia bacterium]
MNHSVISVQRFKSKNEILYTDANLERHCESRFWGVMTQSHPEGYREDCFDREKLSRNDGKN